MCYDYYGIVVHFGRCFFMGIYLNPDNEDFQQSLNSKIYVDKSELIAYTNGILRTEQKYICVSRPRRFGKSMAANMLTAYYSRGCDSRKMFSDLKIAHDKSFEKHLNKYNVIHLNIRDFLSESDSMTEMLKIIEEDLLCDLDKQYSDIEMPIRKTLVKVLSTIFAEEKIPFVFVIDEWDCIFRVHKNDSNAQKMYLDFLRNILKDKSYVAIAYMTGILPVKKYGEHSAINVFYEYSMTGAKPIEEFTGFTEQEVLELCEKYQMPLDEFKRWYDGYNVDGISIYNPKSVVEALLRKSFNNYWTQTETYEALMVYIQSDEMGVQDIILKLIAGEKYEIDTATFSNDMVTFTSADDVLTLLVHLGYLTYDFDSKTISIPNHEVMEQFISTTKNLGWNEVVESLKVSQELLNATLAMNEEKVAELIEQAHQDNTSILKYNDENSLSCVVSIAYYSARKNYVMYREMPAGKGFADLVFIPRKNCSLPPFIVELKQQKSSEEAIEQIFTKDYADALKDYKGEVLLVGINYDCDKHHTCKIEKVVR